MRYCLLLLLLFTGPAVFPQSAPPSTYAVIAGISSYASKGIPALRFANKDAAAFSDYLKTEAGGKVPDDNIKLLVNEEATTAAIYSALSWLNEVSGKDDLVYFYFSGHGDLESETIYKLGFLLTYNTPRTNYINNAIRIEDINNFANSLSLKNGAKVVIITDACHSGNLAGSDFRGNSLVGKSLSKSKANEIRIASCRPDQLSMEDEAWGGGRGVFSFHLINGLTGFAAKPGHDIVTVQDLRHYLDSSLSKDIILKREKHQQNAVIDGPDLFTLAKPDRKKVMEIGSMGLNIATPPPLMTSSAAEESIETMLDEFAGWIKKQKLNEGFDYATLQSQPRHKVAAAWLGLFKTNISQYIENKTEEERVALDKMLVRIDALQKTVLTDSSLRKQLERVFAVSIHDYAQNIINAYLEGDAAELERRRYYNAAASGYDIYPVMYTLAMKLTDPDDYLYRILEVNRYYFGGLALIVKLPMTEDQEPLIEEAMKLEKKALEMEENAPYIYNCLGTLYYYKGDYFMADSMYRTAIKMAPQWALPYNNLLGLYLTQNKIEKAKTIYPTAKEKGTKLADFYTNAGLLHEMEGDWLMAEEMQRKSIFLNSRHFLPFERLAGIFLQTTNYALADSFYFEADVRKRNYHFKKFLHSTIAAPFMLPESVPAICKFDSTRITRDDAAGYFAWGMLYFIRNDYAAAELKWKHLIQIDPGNPLAFHYLGKIQFSRKNWSEADLMFRFALKNYLEGEAALRYEDSLLQHSGSADKACFRSIFYSALYERAEDHAFLGTVYRDWKHYTLAEDQFRKLLALMPTDFAANKTLWQMWEHIGKYQDAEALIKLYTRTDSKAANDELNSFYKRMIKAYPLHSEWYLKAGVFLYEIVRQDPDNYKNDRKRIFPDQTVAEPVLLANNRAVSSPIPVTLIGTKEMVRFESPIQFPYSDAIQYLSVVDSLVGNNLMLTADVNDKLGDLHTWQGVPLYAAQRYQASIDASPSNAGVRIKLIDAYDETFQFSEASKNLLYLKLHDELNMEMMLLLADYSMRQSKFSTADSLLSKAKNIYPYPHHQIMDLQARNALMQKKADEAIAKYELLLEKEKSNTSAMYSISRMYALKKNTAKAMLWLNKAYDKGFNYGWVLNNDPLMAGLRNSHQWKSFISKGKFLEYPEPSNTLPRATE
jgi:Tfp pilus assembly protein PilF